MKKLIYYPSFEPSDVNWLKYALIYLDEFSPIIPERGNNELSNTFSQIQNETDVVNIYKPQWQQGDNASTKALKEIEFIRSHPEQYYDKLHSFNINRKWEDPHNWNFELYSEKFNTGFKDECINMGLGIESQHGLLTSKELAQIFMTFLSEEIAFDTKANAITDSEEFDQLTTYLRGKNVQTEEHAVAAKTVIDISLPYNLTDTDIKKFIEFRNQDGIKELRRSFNNSLNNFYSKIEDDFYPQAFIENLQRANKDLVKEIVLFFAGIVSTGLGATILLNAPNNLEAIKQTIEGSIFTIVGVAAINKAWKDGKENRAARKFLSKINQIR